MSRQQQFALTLTIFFLSTVYLSAQNIWGASATTGITDGQFSNAFVEGTYSPGSNISSWTASSISDGNGVPGAAYWIRSTSGVSQGAFVDNPTVISSPSQANGVAIFDSDFLDNGGIESALGSGTSPSK